MLYSISVRFQELYFVGLAPASELFLRVHSFVWILLFLYQRIITKPNSLTYLKVITNIYHFLDFIISYKSINLHSSLLCLTSMHSRHPGTYIITIILHHDTHRRNARFSQGGNYSNSTPTPHQFVMHYFPGSDWRRILWSQCTEIWNHLICCYASLIFFSILCGLWVAPLGRIVFLPASGTRDI